MWRYLAIVNGHASRTCFWSVLPCKGGARQVNLCHVMSCLFELMESTVINALTPPDTWFDLMQCNVWLGGRVVRMLDCDQWVAGLNPGLPTVECNPGQVVNTRASVTKQYNLVPANW